MLEMDSIAPANSISVYVDYPDELVTVENGYVSKESICELVVRVVYAVAAVIVESHMASIPVFKDRLYQLIEDVVTVSIAESKILLDVTESTKILANFIYNLDIVIAPILRGYVPPVPDTFSTTLIDVSYRSDCIILTIHY